MLHILHSFLGQSELSNFFVYNIIISAKNTTETLGVQTTHHFPKNHSAPGVEGLCIKMKTLCGPFATSATSKLGLSNKQCNVEQDHLPVLHYTKFSYLVNWDIIFFQHHLHFRMIFVLCKQTYSNLVWMQWMWQASKNGEEKTTVNWSWWSMR